MRINKVTAIKQFLFYFILSFAAALSGYFLLSSIMAKNRVFASWLRMFNYHDQHPVSYIIIPCFIYSCMAIFTGRLWRGASLMKQIGLTLLIVFLTIFISSPFGGMLWYYHDMQAGFFPESWISKMMSQGISSGFGTGWLIIALSFPYNILGVIVCFFITKAGSHIFYKKQMKPVL